VWSLRITGEGLLISGSVDGTIRVWRQEAHTPLNSSGSISNLSKHEQTLLSNGSGDLVDQAIDSSSSLSVHQLQHDSNDLVTGDCTWICEHTVESDGPVYSLCCLGTSVDVHLH
jgi:hypothetical protein